MHVGVRQCRCRDAGSAWKTAYVAANEANADKRTRRTAGVGPTGRTFAENLARIRKARGLSTVALAKLLDGAGQPIVATGITKIEQGDRRVTLEEAVAFAVALNVNVSALVLPPTTEGDTEVTGAGAVPAEAAWAWADGEQPLRDAGDESAFVAFQLHGRPPGRRRFHAAGT